MDKTQLIVWLGVAVLAAAKWLFENADIFQGGRSGETPDTKPLRPSQPREDSSAERESEEEKVRRFMQALGLPPEGVPPPARVVKQPSAPVPAPTPAPRRMDRPVRPLFPAPVKQVAPVVPAGRANIAPPLETGGPLPSIPKTASVAETAPSMQVASIPQMVFDQPREQARPAAPTQPSRADSRKTQPAVAQAALREELRGPAALRKAILLREILGAPKGLQSAQSPSIFSPL